MRIIVASVHQVSSRRSWGLKTAPKGRLVLPFGPEARSAIADEKMGFDTPDQPDEVVVVFNIRSAADVDHALCLLRFAYLISDLDRNQVRPSRTVDTEVCPALLSDGVIVAPLSAVATSLPLGMPVELKVIFEVLPWKSE
jgi:hypothetical protein